MKYDTYALITKTVDSVVRYEQASKGPHRSHDAVAHAWHAGPAIQTGVWAMPVHQEDERHELDY